MWMDASWLPTIQRTWWWNETIDNVVKVKWKARRWQKSGGSKEQHLKVKRAAKAAVYFAKKDAQHDQFASINNNSAKNLIFNIEKRLKQVNVDVVGGKCVQNDAGKLTLITDEKFKVWQSHYQKLLNVEFQWNASNLSDKRKGWQLRILQRWCLK